MTPTAYSAWNLVAGLVAGAFCVYAGVYLLRSHAAASDSYLELIAHGLGWYMIGKGIFVAAALGLRGMPPTQK